MTELKPGTWVLVADGEKALFLQNDGEADHPDLNVLRKTEQENPPNREQAANRRGRFNDGPQTSRSAVEDTDWHKLAKDRFADDLADLLYKQVHAGKCERLVLVAPPGVLGELRRVMHQEVADRVIGEVPKTLTNHPLDKIEVMLRDALKQQ